MVIATSSLLSILRRESDAMACARAIERAQTRRLSAANYVEVSAIIDASRDPILSRRFDELIEIGMIRIEPVTERQARIARDAFRDFGHRTAHAAQLSFGECFAYALAKAYDEPLLYTNEGFAHLDLRSELLATGSSIRRIAAE